MTGGGSAGGGAARAAAGADPRDDRRDRGTGALRWTGTVVDLVFGSNSELRAIADVVPEPSLAAFTDANQQLFSAARQSTAFSWKLLAGSANVVGR